MKQPFELQRLGLLILGLVVLMALLQFGMLRIAFDRLGLSQQGAALLFLVSFAGSILNIPLFSFKDGHAAKGDGESQPTPHGLLRPPLRPYTGRTVVACNVGGCVVPVAFSGYLLLTRDLFWPGAILGIALVAALSRFASFPVRGIGIAMPVLIAPLAAAIIGPLLGGDNAAAMAYITGTLGVLIGADLMRLQDIRRMAVPFASIGGAGTFDGIFITGIVAVLLTWG